MFKLDFLTNILSAGFDWRELNPNVPAVKNFYLKCGTLYDGYQFPNDNPNGTLAGRRMEGFTIPLMFGINEYYELNETTITPSGEFKKALLWCGELHTGMRQAFGQSGGQGVLRACPYSIESAIFTLFGSDTVAIFMVLIESIMKYFPPLRRGGYFFDTQMGNIITRKIYLRREFAFLECFSLETWLTILASLLILSNITTLIGKRRSSDEEYRNQAASAEIWIYQQARKKHRKRNTFAVWWRVALDFFGAILGEEMPSLNAFNRGIVGVWLLASVIFNGCLSSSLRELMSKAQVVYTPEGYEDIFRSYLYSDHIIALSNYLPSWYGIAPLFAEEIAERRNTSRLLLLDPFMLMDTHRFSLITLIKIVIDIFLEIDHYVLIMFKRFFFMAIWGATVCRPAVDRGYATVAKHYDTISRNTGFDFMNGGGFLGLDNLDPITEEDVAQAHDRIEEMLRDMRDHVHVSEGSGSMQWYFTFMQQCPEEVKTYLNGFFVHFRDAGFIQLLDEMYEETLQQKFVTSQQLAWQDNAAGWEVVRVSDFYGPLAAYSIFVIFAWLGLFLEVFWFKISDAGKRKKANRCKIHPEAHKVETRPTVSIKLQIESPAVDPIISVDPLMMSASLPCSKPPAKRSFSYSGPIIIRRKSSIRRAPRAGQERPSYVIRQPDQKNRIRKRTVTMTKETEL